MTSTGLITIIVSQTGRYAWTWDIMKDGAVVASSKTEGRGSFSSAEDAFGDVRSVHRRLIEEDDDDDVV
jgi:hypothetical protein